MHTKDPKAQVEALKINTAVLEFRKRLLGEFSQLTLGSYSTCGKSCDDAGEIRTAGDHLRTCLERRKRAAWNDEGVTSAQSRYAKVLRSLAERAQDNEDEEKAQMLVHEARTREAEVARAIKRYRQGYKYYMPESEDEEENLDKMVSIWAGRFTGGLTQPEPSATNSVVKTFGEAGDLTT